MSRRFTAAAALLVSLPAWAGGKPPVAPLPAALAGVDVVEQLGATVPPDLSFLDQRGRTVELGKYFNHGRPVVLTLVYFRCPMLCSLVQAATARALRGTAWRLGEDYDAVTVSFAEDETPPAAAEARAHHLQSLGFDPGSDDWPFLTGSRQAIKALTEAVGFRFNYDPGLKQYAHTAAIYVLTPTGTVSRYLYGVDFPPRDLRLALAEAGEGRVGPSFDRFLLSCYRYNPATRRYGLFVRHFLQAGGFIVFIGVALLVGLGWRRELLRGRGR